jgi:rubrerythrin
VGISTCSEAISLSRELENDAADVYRDLATRYEEGAELFSSFAKENAKYVTQIERAYYGVITDAIEGGFAFDLDPDEYRPSSKLATGASFSDALKEALAIETKSLRFYETAAEQSKHLMADVPRAFTLVAKRRRERIAKIKALLERTK